METNSQSCTFLARVFFWWWGICLCKLPCELAATTALFAHIPVVRAEKKKRPFPLIVGWKYAPRQQAQHIHCAVVLFTPLYLRGVCVCTQKELFLWGLEGNLVAPFNCFLPEASTNLLGSAPRGVAIVLFFFLHEVMFALLLKSKVVSKLLQCHTWHSFYLRSDVLHGNWPRSHLKPLSFNSASRKPGYF